MISRRTESVRAVVGVTSNRLLADGVHRDWLRRKYVQALVRYAGVACAILPTIDADDAEGDSDLSIMGRLDGLILTGDESNIDPAIFSWSASRRLKPTGHADVQAGVRIVLVTGCPRAPSRRRLPLGCRYLASAVGFRSLTSILAARFTRRCPNGGWKADRCTLRRRGCRGSPVRYSAQREIMS